MKTKIVEKLRNEYANLGLGEKAFSGVAAFLEKTGIKEDDIESRVKGDDVKALLVAIQGESDSLRNTNSRLTKENEELKAKIVPPDKKPDQGDDGTAKAIAELASQFKTFKESLDAEAKRRADAALMDDVHRIMKANGCANDFIRTVTLQNVVVSDGDTAESLAEKYRTDYDSNCKKAFGDGCIPPKGQQVSKEYEAGGYSSEVERLRASGKLPGESK